MNDLLFNIGVRVAGIGALLAVGYVTFVCLCCAGCGRILDSPSDIPGTHWHSEMVGRWILVRDKTGDVIGWVGAGRFGCSGSAGAFETCDQAKIAVEKALQ